MLVNKKSKIFLAPYVRAGIDQLPVLKKYLTDLNAQNVLAIQQFNELRIEFSNLINCSTPTQTGTIWPTPPKIMMTDIPSSRKVTRVLGRKGLPKPYRITLITSRRILKQEKCSRSASRNDGFCSRSRKPRMPLRYVVSVFSSAERLP